MKITAIKTWLCDVYRANLAFVKIETDAGVHGFGEATIEFHDRAVIGCLEDLTPELLGRDPRDIEALWHDAYRDAYWRGGPVLTSALAGLEMACWDIKGKVLEQPVWQLLGGQCRDRVRCYANAWFVPAKTPAEFATKAREAVARGWKALKWDPFGSAYRDILPGELRDAIRCVAAVREAVGDAADLLIEGHGRFNVPSALRIGQALAEFGILWFEEPLFPELNAALPELKLRVPVPIAAGERIYTRYQARDFLDQRCGDFIKPDISHVGIKEMRLIGGMADAAGVGFCPHNPAGPITNLATLHIRLHAELLFARNHGHRCALAQRTQRREHPRRGRRDADPDPSWPRHRIERSRAGEASPAALPPAALPRRSHRHPAPRGAGVVSPVTVHPVAPLPVRGRG